MANRGKTSYVISYAIFVALILAGAGILFAQSGGDRALFVNGKAAGTVVQVGGHSYIDLETVAQITNGSVTIEANRILLTTSAPAAPAAAPAQVAAAPPPLPGLSREFTRGAIAELAEMREWRGAVGTILTYGVPVVGTWPQDYHDRVNSDLMQVGVSAATAADQDALELLRNEFSNLAQWASDVVSTRQSMNATNSVNPNAVQNDQSLKKISDCSQFLSAMLVSGAFADNASCH